MNKFLVVITKDDKGYGSLVPDLKCIGVAKSRETILKQTSEAIALALELADTDKKNPVITSLDGIGSAVREDIPLDAEIIFLEPAPMNPVSREIEEAITHAGITQAELARKLGVARSAVNRIINPFYWGHSLEMLRRVADALGLRLEVHLNRSA